MSRSEVHFGHVLRQFAHNAAKSSVLFLNIPGLGQKVSGFVGDFTPKSSCDSCVIIPNKRG